MPPVPIPQKPFDSFKWRWAVLTPTEGLNYPPVFLGVLRVINTFSGHAPGSTEVLEALRVVQQETGTSVDLVRSSDRNLFRNSAQYWRAFGLLEPSHGSIVISDFGRMLAQSDISHVEFASVVIKTLELPNRHIEDHAEWTRVGLRIKPLEILLSIMAVLKEIGGDINAYLSVYELIKIVIPLSGCHATIDTYVSAICKYRDGSLSVVDWVDCVPSANDMRMAKEFLVFLTHYGFCTRKQNGSGNEGERYYLSGISTEEVSELCDLSVASDQPSEAVRRLRETQIPVIVERRRVARNALERPYQGQFRNNVLAAYECRCLITGVNLPEVLVAAHIKPVEYNGTDDTANGICLRADVHNLYDSNHLKILPSGVLSLSAGAAIDRNYGQLPESIVLPTFVNLDYIDFRNKYC